MCNILLHLTAFPAGGKEMYRHSIYVLCYVVSVCVRMFYHLLRFEFGPRAEVQSYSGLDEFQGEGLKKEASQWNVLTSVMSPCVWRG